MNAPLVFQNRIAVNDRHSVEAAKRDLLFERTRTKTPMPAGAQSARRSSDQSCHAVRYPLVTRALGHDFSRVRVNHRRTPGIQRQLSIGAPADRFEREADQIAEQVVQSVKPVADRNADQKRLQLVDQIEQRNQRIQREIREPYSLEEGSEQEEQDQTLQTQSLPGHMPKLTPSTESRIHALQGGGQALPENIRFSMESRFVHDFSKVRIHHSHEAAELATSINARAFALGPDLVFGPNQYAPDTQAGLRLLAHELTHSIQQGHAPPLHPTTAKEESLADGFAVIRQIAVPKSSGTEEIRRVQWVPNVDTGKKKRPWGTGPNGKILKAKTDTGTEIPIWRPDDGNTYWCHGFTFGGVNAKGGPYSLWGKDVPTVLKDDGWKPAASCAVNPGDILVFEGNVPISHSGIVKSIAAPGRSVDEDASMLDSKWGSSSQNVSSWQTNARQWGAYRCFSKSPALGGCKYRGPSEADETFPLPPGDFPSSKGETRVV